MPDEHHPRPRGPTRAWLGRQAGRLVLLADTAVLSLGVQGNALAATAASALSILLRLVEHACAGNCDGS